MAEFCLDCWNRLNGTHYTPQDVKTDLDLCEGCKCPKPVIVAFSHRKIASWLMGTWRRLEYLAQCQRR